MKRMYWFLASAVLTVALVSGATFALFSDTANSQNNTFSAGRLCLVANRNDGDPVPGPMFYVTAAQGQTPSGVLGTLPTGVWAPGNNVSRTMTIDNPTSCSNLNGWLTSVQAEMQTGSFAGYENELYVTVKTPHGGSDVIVAEGYLSTFLAGPVPIHFPDGTKIPVYLTANRHLHFNVKLDLDTSNAFQGQSAVVKFIVNGEQMANNP